MARSSVSSTQKLRGRPVRTGGLQLLYGSLYKSLDGPSPAVYLYRTLQISRGLPMAHLDIAQTQKLLRQEHQNSSRGLRRQIVGAALILALGGGYFLWHGGAARSAPEAA